MVESTSNHDRAQPSDTVVTRSQATPAEPPQVVTRSRASLAEPPLVVTRSQASLAESSQVVTRSQASLAEPPLAVTRSRATLAESSQVVTRSRATLAEQPYVIALRRATRRPTRRHSHRRWWTAIMRTAWVMLLLAASVANADRDDDRAGERDDDEAVFDERDDVAVDIELDASGGASPLVKRAPSIGEVLEAAYEAAGLAHDPTRSWARRARVAGLIPWLTVRGGWNANWREEEPDVGRSRTFEVRATWRLDRLLFDSRELQVASIDASRRRERRRLASRVIRTYFAWRKVTTLASGNSRYALTAEAATAELDALTDGWFSERINSAR